MWPRGLPGSAYLLSANGSQIGFSGKSLDLSHLTPISRKKKAALPVKAHRNPLTFSGLQKRWLLVARTGMRFRAPCEW